MNDDWEYDDEDCPKCGSNETRRADCWNGCDDGVFDEAEYDPVNFAPGELLEICEVCHGYGVLRWCARCGHDLNRRKGGTPRKEE